MIVAVSIIFGSSLQYSSGGFPANSALIQSPCTVGGCNVKIRVHVESKVKKHVLLLLRDYTHVWPLHNNIILISFAYKYGLPNQICNDRVWGFRFLRNGTIVLFVAITKPAAQPIFSAFASLLLYSKVAAADRYNQEFPGWPIELVVLKPRWSVVMAWCAEFMSTVVARAVRMRVAMFWLYTDSALCSNMQLCTRIGELNLHTCTCTSGMRCDRGVKTWRLGPCRDTSNIFDILPSTAYRQQVVWLSRTAVTAAWQLIQL